MIAVSNGEIFLQNLSLHQTDVVQIGASIVGSYCPLLRVHRQVPTGKRKKALNDFSTLTSLLVVGRRETVILFITLFFSTRAKARRPLGAAGG